MENLNNSEKIHLACNQIAFMSNQLFLLQMQLSMSKVNKEYSSEIPTGEILKNTANKLTEVMNELADFMSDRDMVTDIDNALFDGIFTELNKDGE